MLALLLEGSMERQLAKAGSVDDGGDALSLVDKALEGFPIAVDDDAAELSDGLDALLDPAHPAVVAALREHELDGPLDDAAPEDEVSTTQAAVADVVDTLGDVVP